MICNYDCKMSTQPKIRRLKHFDIFVFIYLTIELKSFCYFGLEVPCNTSILIWCNKELPYLDQYDLNIK